MEVEKEPEKKRKNKERQGFVIKVEETKQSSQKWGREREQIKFECLKAP